MTHSPRKGLLIQPDGHLKTIEVTSFIDIKQAVGGDFDWTSQSDIICYCYEWALYEMPVNPVASAIYRSHNDAFYPLAGPVLVMGRADMAGDETDCPPAVVAEAEQIKARLGPERIAYLAVELDEEQKNALRSQNAKAMDDLAEWLEERRRDR